tara:strand:+ start:995 stop:1339 length:345 start_codon:yes stop_codon:yes gene_type:complete
MKKLLFILITLITVSKLIYASFPVTGINEEIISTIVYTDTEKEEPSLIQYILRGVLVISILGFVSYFLIRAWWRSWKDNIKWVKTLTYILSVMLVLLLILVLILNAIFRNGYLM